MSFLLDGLKSLAGSAGTVLADTGLKAKIRADILLLDRDMRARKAKFGVELYDFVAPLAARPDFFAANDRMTETIRGPFLAAQREIAALAIKRQKIKEKAAQAEIVKKSAFPTPAETIAGQVLNAGKAVGYAGKDAAIATELSMCDARIKNEKQEFGIAFFDVLVQMEDEEGWLPTVRDIRTMYDQVRRDLEKLEAAKAEKQKELLSVGGSNDDMPPTSVQPKAPIAPLPTQNGPPATDPFANGGPIDPWSSKTADQSNPVPPTSAAHVTPSAISATGPESAMPQFSVEQLAMSAAGRATPGVAGMVLSAAARVPAPTSGLFSYPTHHDSSGGYGSSSAYAPPRVSVPTATHPAPAAPLDPFASVTTPAMPPPTFDPFEAPSLQPSAPAWDPFANASTSATNQPANAEYDPFAGL